MRVFGLIEAVFDVSYLAAASSIGLALLFGSGGGTDATAGIMALILVLGDAFHLIPRIKVILTGREESSRQPLGRGKQIASVTMTVFYVLLWQLGVSVFLPLNSSVWSYAVYALAMIRVILCLFPQNRWAERYPPVNWGILRNVPFFLLGASVAVLYLVNRGEVHGLRLVWLAVILSFVFYLPVVLWSNKNPKVGIFMLPKSAAYVWLIAMFLGV